MQAVAHDLTSVVMESQTYFFLSNFVVLLLDGWDRPCTMLKTCLLNDGGTHGRGVPVLVSQMIAGPSGISILSSFSDESWRGAGGGDFSCSAASVRRSSPQTVRAWQFLERASATELDFPEM